jgi:hypothetical protein
MLSFKQTPHCDGANSNRVLFNKQARPSDPLFISGLVNKNDEIVIGAGEAQGVLVGAKVGIYASNFAVPANLLLGVLTVSTVEARESILEPFTPGPTFYGKIRRLSLAHHKEDGNEPLHADTTVAPDIQMVGSSFQRRDST